MSATTDNVETAAIVFPDRWLPASAPTDAARAIAASGVVDSLVIPDQLNNFVPPSLWTTENAPLAATLPDIDSPGDAFMTAAQIAAAAPEVSITVTTDSVRRGPAELIQAMLTLANMTKGRATFQVGGGEQKQCRAYGHKRGQGLKRMEDLFAAFDKLWDTDGPIDHEGNVWTLKGAYLGGAKPYKPRLWGLGGGPKLIELSATYCDGFAAAAPPVWATPDDAAERIAAIKRDIESRGRDPEAFGFGIFSPVLLHEDRAVLDRLIDNPITRWMVGTYGRIDPNHWAKVGLDSPTPLDWTYYMQMVPYQETPEFIDRVVSATTRDHVEAGMFIGTPEAVAATLRAYVDAGVNWVLPVDYAPLMLEPADAIGAVARSIEVAGHLRA